MEKKLTSAIKAGYAFFYCQTAEVSRAVIEIAKRIESMNGYTAAIWDFINNPDPDAAIQAFDEAPPKTVLIAKNLNWFLTDNTTGDFNKGLVSLFQTRSAVYSSPNGRKILIIVSDEDFMNAIPGPIQKEFFNLNFTLPGLEDIKKEYDFIVSSAKAAKPDFSPPDEQTEQDIYFACRGMTTQEIQNALSFSLVQQGNIDPKIIAKIRASGIEKIPGVKIGRSDQGFDALKGYENVKGFAKDTARHPLAKGIMLLGPPGTGKTQFCRCLSYETGLELFELEMAQMFGSLVGETEKQVKKALDVISVNAPAIVLVDEIEKALAGMKGSGVNDGGTTQRAMAQFLKFLSEDRPEGLYIVATCNDISKMPPEWIRAERWDGLFFVDLPSPEEQAMILEFYRLQFNVTGTPSTMSGWSGAEIKSVCRIAAMMKKPIEEVQRFIVPVSKTMGAEIDRLRKWAVGKTIPASNDSATINQTLTSMKTRSLEMN